MTFGDHWWWFCRFWRDLGLLQRHGFFNDNEAN